MLAENPLDRVIAEYPSALVGYSGGVDSALVAVVARQVLGAERSVAAIGVSPSLSRVQHEQAVRIAERFRLNLVEVVTDELNQPDYVANRTDRCYYCKRELWTKLSGLAAQIGMAVAMDGTNADDLYDHRPGTAAATEFAIVSPLAQAGYGKEDVRAEARKRGIPIWDAPASPCLSSRVLYGLTVTPERLQQVERGEAFLRGIGVSGDLRVRHRGAEARIEVAPSQFPLIRQQQTAIGDHFRDLGFSRVALDLGGYRSGNLLVESETGLEMLAGGR